MFAFRRHLWLCLVMWFGCGVVWLNPVQGQDGSKQIDEENKRKAYEIGLMIVRARFAAGDQVLVPLQNGMPSDTGLGLRRKAVIARVDGPFIDVTYIWDGVEKRERTQREFLLPYLETRFESVALKGHKAEVTGLSFSEDGATLASICPANGNVRLWDMGTQAVKDEFWILRDEVRLVGQGGSISLIPGGGLAMQIDKRLYFSVTEKGDVEPILFSKKVLGYAISPDGKTLVTIEPDEEGKSTLLYLWTMEDVLANQGQVKYKMLKLKLDPARTSRLAVMNQTAVVIVASRPKDAVSRSDLFLYSSLHWSLEGEAIPWLVGDAIAITNSVDSLDARPQLFVHGNQLCELDYGNRGRVRDEEPVIKVRAELSGMPSGDGSRMTCAAFEPGQRWLVTGHVGGQLCFYNALDGKELASFQASAKDVRALAISPDGKSAATSDGSDVVIWKVPELIPKSNP